jgi:hypothetical protein
MKVVPRDSLLRELGNVGSLAGTKKGRAHVVGLARSGRLKCVVRRTMRLDKINEGALEELCRSEHLAVQANSSPAPLASSPGSTVAGSTSAGALGASAPSRD